MNFICHFTVMMVVVILKGNFQLNAQKKKKQTFIHDLNFSLQKKKMNTKLTSDEAKKEK